MNSADEHAPEAPRGRTRTQVWILVGVFFAPLFAAFLLYYGAGWQPSGSTSHGDLIQPPRPLPQVQLQAPSGARLGSDLWRGKWSLLYIGDGQCDARCREALVLTRQTHLALNDDFARAQRVFLVTANCCDQAYLEREHADLIIAKADDIAGRKVLDAFPDRAGIDRLGRIYLVDPLGNLMMSYGPEAPPKGLLTDLKKLLKLSHIG